MLGASFTVVSTSRYRQSNGNSLSHPFPEEDRISASKHTRDEQGRRWIENRQACSEDDYETNSSSGAFSKQVRRISGRAHLDANEFSLDHKGSRRYEDSDVSH
jgi:hypothetical protein